ncbi:MAG: flagellar biosynthesis protein FliQ [Candidatus Sericytochromatia bacterium]|nr:flagellar biosynthesis protein FliQ [Candidatus Sericytochromatia bacterium]
MDQSIIITQVSKAILLIIVMSLPIILTAMIIGFSVSILQAITQVQEQTLSFVPKSLCVYGMIILLSPWMLNTILEFVMNLFKNIPTYLLR